MARPWTKDAVIDFMRSCEWEMDDFGAIRTKVDNYCPLVAYRKVDPYSLANNKEPFVHKLDWECSIVRAADDECENDIDEEMRKILLEAARLPVSKRSIKHE